MTKGLTQCIGMGKSIRLIWVKLELNLSKCFNVFISIIVLNTATDAQHILHD